jgi:hypothetical protein
MNSPAPILDSPNADAPAPTPGKRRSFPDWVLLVAAFCIFSWGIWKARVGFGDDTTPLLQALHAADAQTYPGNLYVLAYTLLLRWITPDPMNAALIMRTVISLSTTLSLYYVLSAFRPYLHRMAIVMACAIWMVSHLNSPLVQYSNLSPFTFIIASLGLGWLLRRPSWTGLLGFLVTIACAASLRPEYMAPALLIGGGSALVLLWKAIGARLGTRLFWSGCSISLLLAVAVIAPRFRAGSGMDRYLLFGLGQCYAAFYKGEHPNAPFHPMTEYKVLLDDTFGEPTSFFGAIAYNPREASRYFALNTFDNLRRLPATMLSTRQTVVPTGLAGRWHAVFLLVTVLAGGALVARRFIHSWSAHGRPWMETLRRYRHEHAALLRQILLVVLFCSASSVAIVLLVASPRYWISWVPLIFLTVATCFDALLRLKFLQRYPWIFVMAILALFCRPLFLGLGPNENFEVNALRRLAPELPKNPVIAGVYTSPYQAYAFSGHAVAVNAGGDLSTEGVREGRYDVLIVDDAMRSSRVWNNDREFFESFVAEPAPHGYTRLKEGFPVRRSVYYRVRPAMNP